MILVNEEEIIEVSADLARRRHGGKDVKLLPLREGRKDVRQHIRLNARGESKLDAEALLLRRNDNEIANVGVHVLLHALQALI